MRVRSRLNRLAVLLPALVLFAAGAAPASTTPALRVLTTAPRGPVAGDYGFTVRFSAPLAAAAKAPAPKLAPRLAGAWRQTSSTTLRFTPASAYLPDTVVHLTIPAGIRAANGSVLARAVTLSYRIGEPSSARLPQLLADLRYLPVHFVSRRDPRAGDADGQLQALYSPPSGHLAFGHGWPAHLHWLWAVDNGLVIRGALMSFQSQHGLAMTGRVSTQVWEALLWAREHWRLNRSGYSYALASEASPESFTLYHNGRVVVRTPANTGVPGAGTAQGTFPVYERLRSQVMQGTNLDGSHYADYVQWVAYFNGGDAVHYMPRADYGSPQSLGCVELPYAVAARAWGYLSYGTLVSVEG